MGQKLTPSQKLQGMKYRGWKVQRFAGTKWVVYDGKGNRAASDESKTKAIHAAWEKFIFWREQDRLGQAAQCVMNWQAPYTKI